MCDDNLPTRVLRLPVPTRLFPTPKASDGPHGGPNQRSSKGVYDALPGAVVNMLPAPRLFKTPTAQLGRNGSAQHPDKRRSGGHGPTLDDEVSFLLPGAVDEVQDWVDFEPAIRRQEALSRREAPIPTELGPRGGRRLAARFAEWLMWIPDGHVTAVPGLSRSEQLQRIGNGVVPIQALTGYEHLMNLMNATKKEAA